MNELAICMDELAKWFGVGSFGLMLGGIVGYLVRLWIEQRLKKQLEDHKHALAVLGRRLDFLHQERGKAALAMVRLTKVAKAHVNLLVDPMQRGPVDPEQACRDSHAACTDLHNLLAESSFLFPKPLEDHMLKTRQTLWRILDQATLQFQEATRRGESPFNNQRFSELWMKLGEEVKPLENAMIAEIRILLGATEDDDRSTAQGPTSPR